MEHFASGKPIIEIENDTKIESENDTEVVKQIKELIDQRVRPAVAMDGGDISFCSFDSRYSNFRDERCLCWLSI